MTDPVAGQASIKRRRRDAAQPGTTVIFGHDPAQGTTLRHAPDYSTTPSELGWGHLSG